VISPEGCAAILWKDRAAASKAAEALKITAADLSGLGLVDGVVPEPVGGAHNDPAGMAQTLKERLMQEFAELEKFSTAERLRLRYQKFRAYGRFTEPKTAPALEPA
jgi:acetyl-CoA carboxylase carboxyl transferase subunit alpha